MKLSRTEEDKFAETLGDREDAEEFRKARQEVEEGFEGDDATVDFYATHGLNIKQATVDALREDIRTTGRSEPMPQDVLPEEEEFRLAAVLLLKKGLVRAAEWVKMGVDKPVDESLAEVQQQLENL